MGNAISSISAALLAIVLIFLFPLMQTAQREEDLSTLSAYNNLVQFADAVRNKGYLSREMFEDFNRELARSGIVYDIELEHRHKKYHPEYSDPADATTFQNEFTVVYEGHFTEDVLASLYSNAPSGDSGKGEELYLMQAGDFWVVTLSPRARSSYDILSGYLTGITGRESGSRGLTYGGMILNEDY